MVAPARTPYAVVRRLPSAVAEVVSQAGVAWWLMDAALKKEGSSLAEMGAVMRRESANWDKVEREMEGLGT